MAQYLEDHKFQVLRSYETDVLVSAIKTITDGKHYNDTLNKIDAMMKGKLNR